MVIAKRSSFAAICVVQNLSNRCLPFDRRVEVRHPGVAASAGSYNGLKQAGSSVFLFDSRSVGSSATRDSCHHFSWGINFPASGRRAARRFFRFDSRCSRYATSICCLAFDGVGAVSRHDTQCRSQVSSWSHLKLGSFHNPLGCGMIVILIISQQRRTPDPDAIHLVILFTGSHIRRVGNYLHTRIFLEFARSPF